VPGRLSCGARYVWAPLPTEWLGLLLQEIFALTHSDDWSIKHTSTRMPYRGRSAAVGSRDGGSVKTAIPRPLFVLRSPETARE
jgi:hypothetical protein